MPIRLCKVALTGASSFFLLLVVFNNLTDYGSNHAFVQRVLDMSTTFPGNKGMWRAITSPALQHLFYASIVLWETAAGVLIGTGTWRMWRARQGSASAWHKAKTLAAVGLVVSLLQWYVAFITVGGEWFLMWQSQTWNGQDAAMRMFLMMGVSLIFLMMREDETVATNDPASPS